MYLEKKSEGYRYIDRRDWARVLFYTDLVVIAICVVSIVLLVTNAYYAGYWLQTADYTAGHAALWKVTIATGFLVGSLAWIFFRFFKNQYVVMQRPY
jgi:hypothetical protein